MDLLEEEKHKNTVSLGQDEFGSGKSIEDSPLFIPDPQKLERGVHQQRKRRA